MSTDKAALDALRDLAQPGEAVAIAHYLYVPSESAAQATAKVLRARGFATEARLGADGENWLVLARHRVLPTEETFEALRRAMEQLAAQVGGEYDGWEASAG